MTGFYGSLWILYHCDEVSRKSFLNEGSTNIFVSGAAFRIAPALAEVYLLTEENMVTATGLICILKVIEWNLSPVIPLEALRSILVRKSF
jgi:hypothetical protein